MVKTKRHFATMKFMKRKHILASVSILLAATYFVYQFFFIAQPAFAGTLTSASVTISTSQAEATGVSYNFAFTTTVTTAIKQVNVQFCTTASGSCTAPTGMDTGSVSLSSDNLAGTGRTTTSPAANAIQVVVGTPAAQNTQAVTMNFSSIENPSTADSSFFALITTYSDTGSTVIDTGTVAFATLTSTSIAVTANLGPTFTFTVAAVNSGGTVNGATTNITTTANTIPFGTLADGVPAIGAHDVSVVTNAANGYTVTVNTLANPPLVSGGNDIDQFPNANSAPVMWSAPAGSSQNVNTGYFGYTTNDSALGTGTADRFTSSGGNKWAGGTGGAPITSPFEVAYNSSGTSGAETTRVGWQAEINELQPQGSYTGTVILVATPTY